MVDDVFDSSESIAEFKELMRDPAARQAFVRLKASEAESGARVRYSHILRAVSDTPWAIRPAVLGIIIDILAFRAAGGRLSQEELAERIGGSRRPERGEAPPGIGIIPIHGAIVPKAGMMTEMSGATSVQEVRSALRSAMADRSISSVVFDVDSPGGMVDQVPELAAEIRSYRGKKPMVAIANSEAASAAYWLASQADSLVVNKSSRVGSIGVFTAHEDESARAAAEGVKTTLVSAGKYKTEGNPFEPLSDEGRAHIQSMVDEYYDMFVTDVAKGRGGAVEDVRDGFGQGRVVSARESLRLGMADRTGTLEGVVRGMLVNAPMARMELPGTNSGRLGAMESIDWRFFGSVDADEVPEVEPEMVPEPVPDEELPDEGEGDDEGESAGEASESSEDDDEILALQARIAALKDED